MPLLRLLISNIAPRLVSVTVGTPVARHPPRRSRRALLTHRAPPLGTSVKAHEWIGMQ